MFLYHYRPVESALLEISNGTFHFAARTTLNDPVEGYVRVFWQGDKAAWEGLLRNYICSLNQAITLYLLRGDEDILRHHTLIKDLHQFDTVPLGKILEKLGDAFLADEQVQELTAFFGNRNIKIHEKGLLLFIRYIHSKALTICIENSLQCGVIPEENANSMLAMLRNLKAPAFPFASMKDDPPDRENQILTQIAEDHFEDMMEFDFVRLGFDDESFLYGSKKSEEAPTARQHRDWLSVAVDFPKVYVEELKEMMFPESFVVCFSRKCDDSSMWGNYADHHRGVCLMYEQNRKTHMMSSAGAVFNAKPVAYKGDVLERDFFETFGRLTRAQIKTWLTGTEGISSAYEVFKDEEGWRNSYWSVYDAKTYRKISAWKHEREYRIALTDSFLDRNGHCGFDLKYDPHALKGLIFGINTSEYDKKRILEALLTHADEYVDFSFYQAEYNDITQGIAIRKKALWQLK